MLLNPSHHNLLGSLGRAIQPNLKTTNSPPQLKGSLETYLGEGFADSLVLGHCRLHRKWGQLWTPVAHHSWIDDALGRQAGAAQTAAQVELTG